MASSSTPKKFQLCQKTVEFAGFLLTPEDVKPLLKYLDAITDFPRPCNISEIRSWFGIVNQVSHYAKMTSIMAQFKPLLSRKTRFQWIDKMEWAFQQSKLEIIKAIEEGVKIFDLSRTTVISPDWSKTGIGFFLYQKYCQCPSTTTMCCNNGWRITVPGLRILHKAEENYLTKEVEALVVAWSLEDTKFFTLGCGDLHVQTDHRPLVKLLGGRTMDEIDNRRLINLKEKTMSWRFEIHHVRGRLIPAPDATSRKPHDRSGADQDTDLHVQSSALSAIRAIRDVEGMEACVIAAARSAMPAIHAGHGSKSGTRRLEISIYCNSWILRNMSVLPNLKRCLPRPSLTGICATAYQWSMDFSCTGAVWAYHLSSNWRYVHFYTALIKESVR